MSDSSPPRSSWLLRPLRWTTNFGVTPEMPPTEVKYVQLSNLAASLSVFLSVVFAVLETPLMWPEYPFWLVIRWLSPWPFLAVPLLNRSGRHLAARLFLVAFSILSLTLQSSLYGNRVPIHLFLLAVVGASVALFPTRERRGIFLCVLLTAVAFELALYQRALGEPLVPVYGVRWHPVMETLVAAGAFLLALGVAVFQRETTVRAEQQVVKERAKADRLLRDVLPEPIADRLKERTDRIADGFDEVTVLFADIVGFTPLSGRLAPHQVIGMLDDIFRRMDELADRHGLEKIKTIGDCYMVAGGVPEPRPDHAEAVAAMALDLIPAVHEFETPTGDPLQVRVGMCTGPAVAGVIGKRKFLYDLWGDTVNTASRMESHGEPGRIQVNEGTYHKLADRFEFEERGTVQVKGKGDMRTWFLVSHKGG